MARLFEAGEVFERVHPFTWVTERRGATEDVVERWRPGAWDTKPIAPDDAIAACNGLGTVKFSVVSVHTPPGYPTRVFFKREFTQPDGEKYAASKLINCIARKFAKDITTFPFPFEVVEL